MQNDFLIIVMMMWLNQLRVGSRCNRNRRIHNGLQCLNNEIYMQYINVLMLNQNKTNCFLTFPTISLGITFKTLNLTVLQRGLIGDIKIPALSAYNDVSFFDWSEGWGEMDWYVFVSLFVSVIFGNIMEIVSSDDDCSGHFSGNDNAPMNI